jgi:hypothetical protein
MRERGRGYVDRVLVLLIILVGVATFVLFGAWLRRHRRGRARAVAARTPAVALSTADVSEAAGAPMAVGAPVRRPTPGINNTGASRFRPAGTNVRAIGKAALRR